MKHRSVLIVCLALVTIAVAIAGCGSTATTSAPATSATTAPDTTATSAGATTDTTQAAGLVFGMLLVGPYNDRGYSQAHYDAGLYVEEKIPGSKLVYIDKVNPADRPGTTPAQLAEELLKQGAGLIIFNSDDMKDGALEFAQDHPEIPVIHASGDASWKEGRDFKDLPNMVNLMGEMEYGKMMAGVAAALTTQTGKIGYLGPLINDETRRLAASAYLGAKYAWSTMLGKDPQQLQFKVNWIGFWFNIPGVTADPTQVADDFFNQGYDVVISGIDTTEALVEADKMAGQGKAVWAIPYDYIGAIDEAPKVALGVPYFNWGPAYVEQVQAVLDGNSSGFQWLGRTGPTSITRHQRRGLQERRRAQPGGSRQAPRVHSGSGRRAQSMVGPMNLQDGTPYLKDAEKATGQQIWYLPQLLEGMEGQSVPS